MTKFSRISCIALTWNATGECRGVLVRGRGERISVLAHWQGKADASTSVAECLGEGLDRLGTGDTALVVAGAADAACGVAEVSIPALKANELRGALSFEVARNCPLPVDRVVWAYRRLPMAQGTRLPVRLFYLRQVAWEHWLESLGGLKLDAIIPPQAALDPVLAERDVVLPLANGERFLFSRTAKGGRAVRAASDSQDAFGSGAEPLAWDRLALGPLASLPADEQASYAAALVLGAYGLLPDKASGRADGFPVPYNLQPRRNQLNRFLAVALVLLVATLSLTALGRGYAAGASYLTWLRDETARVKRDISQRTTAAAKGSEDALGALAKELTEANADLDRPSLASVLVELTDTISPNSWSPKFDWHEAAATMEVEESEEDLELIRNLELSPVIGDVLEESKSQNGVKVVRRLKLNARWDVDADAPAPARRRPSDEAPATEEPVPEPALVLPPGAAPPGVPPQFLKREKR